MQQTVDAEIKAMVGFTESPCSWDAGKLISYKWTAEGAFKGVLSEYYATLKADVTCRRYVSISLSALPFS